MIPGKKARSSVLCEEYPVAFVYVSPEGLDMIIALSKARRLLPKLSCSDDIASSLNRLRKRRQLSASTVREGLSEMRLAHLQREIVIPS